MNQIDMFTLLIDSCRQMPENRRLNAAIKKAEAKLERLREKRLQRDGVFNMRKVIANCCRCQSLLADCRCWNEAEGKWLHSPLKGCPMPTVIPVLIIGPKVDLSRN